jgi:hypothetical protein
MRMVTSAERVIPIFSRDPSFFSDPPGIVSAEGGRMGFFIVSVSHREVSTSKGSGIFSHCENLNKEEMHPGIEKIHGERVSHARS